MPYRCARCFIPGIGTPVGHSHIPLDKWLIAIYLLVERGKGASSDTLGCWLGLQQKSA